MVPFLQSDREATRVAPEGAGTGKGSGVEGFHRISLLRGWGCVDGNDGGRDSKAKARYFRVFGRLTADRVPERGARTPQGEWRGATQGAGRPRGRTARAALE